MGSTDDVSAKMERKLDVIGKTSLNPFDTKMHTLIDCHYCRLITELHQTNYPTNERENQLLCSSVYQGKLLERPESAEMEL